MGMIFLDSQCVPVHSETGQLVEVIAPPKNEEPVVAEPPQEPEVTDKPEKEEVNE